MPIRVVAFVAGPTQVSLSPPPPFVPDTPLPAVVTLSTPSPVHTARAMATPSSSATSPSPPIAYLSQASGTQQSTPTHSPNSHEKEERQKAVQKFLARAEIGMVTRALRARLSYASYKATNNIPHVSLRDLEAQTQSQSASFSRTIAAKRKAGVASNHYNNPATQGSTASAASSQRRGGSGAMAPPTSMASPRTHTPSSSIGSTAGYTTYSQVASNLRTGSQVPNLYSSILAPPPAKQARTIHNPSDPPVPAPTRPAPSPRVRTVKPSPKTVSQGKAKAAPKASKGAASPRHRRTNGGASSIDKGKRKQTVDEPDVDMDGDVDMKAAATLTSLLMQHRPSMAGSVSSPRSSIDGSEVGSTYSHSQQHFAQSSARGSGPGHARNISSMSSSSMSGVPTAPASSSNLAAEPPILRHQTPPPHPQGVGGARTHTTPATAAAPTDSEAANLMLFLATSPSPARPQTKDAKDIAAFRALGGGAGALRAKGRVLFPTGMADENVPRHGAALTRGGAGDSFTSSVSSIGGAMDGGGGDGNAASAARHASPAQLLPSAPLPASSAGAPTFGNPPRASADDGPPTDAEPQNSFNFQFHEFMGTTPPPPGWYVPPPYGVSLNVEGSAGGSGAAGRSSGGPAKSPRSPGRSPGAGATTTTTAHKQNLGLRADVGRKLFEEEQTRHAMATAAAAASSGVNAQQRSPALAAGIDLGRS